MVQTVDNCFYYLHRREAYRSSRQSSCGCQTASLAPPRGNLWRLDDQYACNPTNPLYTQPFLYSSAIGRELRQEQDWFAENKWPCAATAKTLNCAFALCKANTRNRILLQKLAVAHLLDTHISLVLAPISHFFKIYFITILPCGLIFTMSN
jgi:hypothetical protein